MKRFVLFCRLPFLFSSLTGLLVQSGCSSSAAKDPPAPSAAPAVKLATPRSALVTLREEVTGTLYPAQALQLGFEVAGRLEKVKVVKGQRVKEGQLLALLNTEMADAQVAQAIASLTAAQAGSTMALDVADRNMKLYQGGSVSDLQAKNTATSASQAKAQVLSAKAALDQARVFRRRHELRAPFAATVINAPEQVGATVSPGSALFTLEQLDVLTLKATVSESARSALKLGDKVKVSCATGVAETDAATLQLIVPSADPTTRRIPVEVSVPNADGRFVAHSLVRAVFPLGEARSAQAIPATALSSIGGDHVYQLSPNGETHPVPVEVLERGQTEVVVRASAPLDKVVDYPVTR